MKKVVVLVVLTALFLIVSCDSGIKFDNTLDEHNHDAQTETLGNICTGQTNCYKTSFAMEECPASGEDFYGQDAQYTSKCTAQSFIVNKDKGVVIDNNTGFIWEQSPSESGYTWEDAPNHCADLNSSNYGGKNNWRVPNPL